MQHTAVGDYDRHKAYVKRRHFLALDALRGVAALVVLLSHWYSAGLGGSRLFYHGAHAVDFFFILSGFVVGRAYEGALRDGRLSFLDFSIKRVIRLYPLLWLGLGLGICVAVMSGQSKDLVSAVAFGLMAIPDFMLDGPVPNPLNPPAWSLFFELLGSFGFALIAPRISDRALIVAVGVTAVWLSYLIFSGLNNAGSSLAHFGGGYVRIAFGFGAGVLLHRLHAKMPPKRTSVRLALVLVALLVASFGAPPFGPYEGYQIAILAIVVCPLVTWYMADFDVGPRLTPIATLSGDLSYPIYILHWPLYCGSTLLLGAYGLTTTHKLAWLRVAILLFVVAFSYLALRIYDVPLRGAHTRLTNGVRSNGPRKQHR